MDRGVLDASSDLWPHGHNGADFPVRDSRPWCRRGPRGHVRARRRADPDPAGCNAGACHGKARGQNGFALSLLGFDPDFDYDAIAHEAGGRRVFPAAPEQSLLLRKATAKVPHGGGRRLEPGGPFYETLRRWIAAGMPRTPADAPRLERITVEPAERIAGATTSITAARHGPLQRRLDRGRHPPGHVQSSEPTLVAVDADGRVKAGPLPGEAAILARFMGCSRSAT